MQGFKAVPDLHFFCALRNNGDYIRIGNRRKEGELDLREWRAREKLDWMLCAEEIALADAGNTEKLVRAVARKQTLRHLNSVENDHGVQMPNTSFYIGKSLDSMRADEKINTQLVKSQSYRP
jgi:hypothetical protein